MQPVKITEAINSDVVNLYVLIRVQIVCLRIASSHKALLVSQFLSSSFSPLKPSLAMLVTADTLNIKSEAGLKIGTSAKVVHMTTIYYHGINSAANAPQKTILIKQQAPSEIGPQHTYELNKEFLLGSSALALIAKLQRMPLVDRT